MAEDEKGNQWPILNVFHKTNEGIFHFYATELLFAPAEKGQNGRHVDSIWPLWNLFDYTPEGVEQTGILNLHINSILCLKQ